MINEARVRSLAAAIISLVAASGADPIDAYTAIVTIGETWLRLIPETFTESAVEQARRKAEELADSIAKVYARTLS